MKLSRARRIVTVAILVALAVPLVASTPPVYIIGPAPCGIIAQPLTPNPATAVSFAAQVPFCIASPANITALLTAVGGLNRQQIPLGAFSGLPSPCMVTSISWTNQGTGALARESFIRLRAQFTDGTTFTTERCAIIYPTAGTQ